MAAGEVVMRAADRLVEQQYAMLLRRDVARLPELYAADAFYSMPGVTARCRPPAWPRSRCG